MILLKPGDLIFYKADNTINGKLISWLQHAFKEMGTVVGSGYIHVAMVSNASNTVVEMTWPRSRYNNILNDPRKVAIFRPKADQITIQMALNWCYSNIGEHYSISEYLFGQFGILQAHRICSGWLDEAFYQAGDELTPKDSLVSPNELASSTKIEKIYEDV